MHNLAANANQTRANTAGLETQHKLDFLLPGKILIQFLCKKVLHSRPLAVHYCCEGNTSIEAPNENGIGGYLLEVGRIGLGPQLAYQGRQQLQCLQHPPHSQSEGPALTLQQALSQAVRT